MQVSVRGKNVEVTDALRDYVFKKVKKLDRYFEGAGETYATLSLEKDQHRVEVTIGFNGLLLRGEEQSPDMYASIDLVVEKLEKQVMKHKEKLHDYRKGEKRSAVAAPSEIAEEGRIIKHKRFDMKPMAADEAVDQMELLDKDFFVFANQVSGDVNVVYRRRDGNYGLIEPVK